MYANPTDPVICPLLALAIEVLSVKYTEADKIENIFDCNYTEKNYSTWLSKHGF